MNTTIQVVEPTLESYSGHCIGLVSSFCRAAADRKNNAVGGKGAERIEFGPSVTVQAYFSRRFRLFQSLFLFRRLLREPFPLSFHGAARGPGAVESGSRKADPQESCVSVFPLGQGDRRTSCTSCAGSPRASPTW